MYTQYTITSTQFLVDDNPHLWHLSPIHLQETVKDVKQKIRAEYCKTCEVKLCSSLAGEASSARCVAMVLLDSPVKWSFFMA